MCLTQDGNASVNLRSVHRIPVDNPALVEATVVLTCYILHISISFQVIITDIASCDYHLSCYMRVDFVLTIHDQPNTAIGFAVNSDCRLITGYIRMIDSPHP